MAAAPDSSEGRDCTQNLAAGLAAAHAGPQLRAAVRCAASATCAGALRVAGASAFDGAAAAAVAGSTSSAGAESEEGPARTVEERVASSGSWTADALQAGSFGAASDAAVAAAAAE